MTPAGFGALGHPPDTGAEQTEGGDRNAERRNRQVDASNRQDRARVLLITPVLVDEHDSQQNENTQAHGAVQRAEQSSRASAGERLHAESDARRASVTRFQVPGAGERGPGTGSGGIFDR